MLSLVMCLRLQVEEVEWIRKEDLSSKLEDLSREFTEDLSREFTEGGPVDLICLKHLIWVDERKS